MDEARMVMLRRRAQQRVRTSGDLLAQVRALDALVRERTPVPVDWVREQLMNAVESDFGNYESGRAAAMAEKLLAYMDRVMESEDEQETPDPPLPWRDPAFTTDEDRMAELKLHLVLEMSRVLRWRIQPPEWHAGSPRVDWVVSEAQAIVASENPLDAADRWLAQSPPYQAAA